MKTCLLLSLLAWCAATLSAQSPTDTSQRQNMADAIAQSLRDIRQEVDLRAGSASQVAALQYREIYDALAQCDTLLAEFRTAPEAERAGLMKRVDAARAELQRLRRDLMERGALPAATASRS